MSCYWNENATSQKTPTEVASFAMRSMGQSLRVGCSLLWQAQSRRNQQSRWEPAEPNDEGLTRRCGLGGQSSGREALHSEEAGASF